MKIRKLLFAIALSFFINKDSKTQEQENISYNEILNFPIRINNTANSVNTEDLAQIYFSDDIEKITEETKNEIAKACIANSIENEETGGYVYLKSNRLKFELVPNVINYNSEAQNAVKTKKVNLWRLNYELKTKHMQEIGCSRYNTDQNEKAVLEELERNIKHAIKYGASLEEKLHLANKVLNLNNISYMRDPSVAPDLQLVGSFHVHPHDVGFSATDRCLYDKSKEKHYLIGCDHENKKYTVYCLFFGKDVPILRNSF